MGFECSQHFVFSELFGDSYKIRSWHENELPEDQLSVNNALVVEKTSRFCLLIDPQGQASAWLKKQHEDGRGLNVIRQADPKFKRIMEASVEAGKCVIVEGVHDFIDVPLQSILKKTTQKYNG